MEFNIYSTLDISILLLSIIYVITTLVTVKPTSGLLADTKIVDGKLFIAMEFCWEDSCEKATYLVSAAIAALIIGSIATIIYIIAYFSNRRYKKKSVFTSPMISGMRMYLILILIQSGLSIGAVAWTAKGYESFGTVRMNCNIPLLTASSVMSFILAVFIFVHGMVLNNFPQTNTTEMPVLQMGTNVNNRSSSQSTTSDVTTPSNNEPNNAGGGGSVPAWANPV